MNNTILEIVVMLSAFTLGALLSAVNSPLLGVALLMGVLSAWGGIKRAPELKKIKINKS